ncbi:hypothetical protein NDU88_000941 [Pleurodeles waltl]|uniref:Uncharacterized protein n=1 Tax=Pleurodeles waltl TaxID=8319 RepID=A0AAV7Q2V0_PLEWA|nr:hypothetical protein NDU88_000941 [Pleurodeles waltl]
MVPPLSPSRTAGTDAPRLSSQGAIPRNAASLSQPRPRRRGSQERNISRGAVKPAAPPDSAAQSRPPEAVIRISRGPRLLRSRLALTHFPSPTLHARFISASKSANFKKKDKIFVLQQKIVLFKEMLKA